MDASPPPDPRTDDGTSTIPSPVLSVPRTWWLAALAVAALATGGVLVVRDGRQTAGSSQPATRLDGSAPAPAGPAGPAGPSEMVGRRLPALPFTYLTGEPGSLADFEGKALVVNFFASWCTPCIEEMPGFERVHRELGDRVAFVGFAMNDGDATAADLVRRTGVTYPIARDPEGEVIRALGGVQMPTTVLVRADATIVEVWSGKLSAEQLEAHLREKVLV